MDKLETRYRTKTGQPVLARLHRNYTKRPRGVVIIREAWLQPIEKEGAGGRNRTDTRFPSRDFESRASTSSTTPALMVTQQLRQIPSE